MVHCRHKWKSREPWSTQMEITRTVVRTLRFVFPSVGSMCNVLSVVIGVAVAALALASVGAAWSKICLAIAWLVESPLAIKRGLDNTWLYWAYDMLATVGLVAHEPEAASAFVRWFWAWVVTISVGLLVVACMPDRLFYRDDRRQDPRGEWILLAALVFLGPSVTKSMAQSGHIVAAVIVAVLFGVLLLICVANWWEPLEYDVKCATAGVADFYFWLFPGVRVAPPSPPVESAREPGTMRGRRR
jgi:hypothetical protein